MGPRRRLGAKGPARQLPPGTVRLVHRGTGPGRGRLKILVGGQWGPVCDDFFDGRAAAVVCRQLGYGQARRVARRAEFGQGAALPIRLECRSAPPGSTTVPTARTWGWGVGTGRARGCPGGAEGAKPC
ncbi:unnamed protein product, partial [Lepidochelys olivacea]